MVEQAVYGVAVIAATSVIHAVFVGVALSLRPMHRLARRWRIAGFARDILLLTFAMVWMIAAHGISIFIWASTLIGVDAVADMETAVYLAMLSYTTLGLGGVEVAPEWRLMPGIMGANGFLLFGFSAAFAVEFSGRLRMLNLRAKDD